MESKQWFQSITIWASAFVAFLQGVPDIIVQVNAIMPGLNLSSNPLVMKALTIIGVIVAIYGRVTAKSTIAPVMK